METSVFFVLTIFLWAVNYVSSHGRLIEPPSRASAWRYGFDTPHNYNDHELYCGGFTRQWVKNEGKCGICGDPWDTKKPRAHEFGGVYGQGVIVRKYAVGGIANIRVELTANHNGYFEFRLCPDYKTATQNCLDQNILKLMKPQEGVDHRNYRYFPKEGNTIYEMKYRLPKQTCKHCVLQWKYVAGNNWGNCPNGTGSVGCGPQEEFRACSDISIYGSASDGPEMIPTQTTVHEDEDQYHEIIPTNIIPDKELNVYNPIFAITISIASFLVAFLILFLLFCHSYQVGDHIWNKLKAKTCRGETKMGDIRSYPPVAPLRLKKGLSFQSTPNISDRSQQNVP